MIAENALAPTEGQVKAMQAPGPDEPICLIDLLQYRETAEYPDGRETSRSGKEAYRRYAGAVNGTLPEYGGRMVFVGEITSLRLGACRAPVGRGGDRSVRFAFRDDENDDIARVARGQRPQERRSRGPGEHRNGPVACVSGCIRAAGVSGESEVMYRGDSGSGDQ